MSASASHRVHLKMDPTKGVEDQFSKLHPSFPVSTRIGIIGGGPSGISAAYALTKLGYNNITVLEKYHTVSGMCESVDIHGRVYDLGGQVLAANSAPTIFSLAKETASELVEMDSHKLALISSKTGDYKDIQVADDYVSVISLTLELQDKAKDSGKLGVHAISEFASDSTPNFLEKRGFKSVPKSVAYGYVASGYGFVQDMPYAYIHEFTRTSMAGKIRRFKDGYMSLWQKISQNIPIDLRCNTEVLSVRRNSESIKINFKISSGDVDEMEFDKIFVSGALPFNNGKTYRSPNSDIPESKSELINLSTLEKDLFSKVQTIDYYTTVLKISAMENIPVGFYYFDEFMEDPATIGNPVAMQRFYEDTNIFLFWSYGNSADVRGERVTELAINCVKNMGGIVEEIVLQRRFKYFPHVSSHDMKDGFYDKVETQLQGNKNTYYLGGLMAFELTERNSSYAMGLVCKHFANDNPLPMFPYVKRLFPVKSDSFRNEPKKSGEFTLNGLPDLSSLDAYLRYWGTNKQTEKKNLYTWINDEGEAVSKRTYEELNLNASCIAQKLLSSKKPIIKPGDRVLLVHVPGLDFVDAFFGCLRARVLPVPVLPSDPLQRGGQALLKIENVAKSCKAVAILSTAGYHLAVRAGSVKSLLSIRSKDKMTTGSWPDLPWIHTDAWIKNSKNSSIEDDINYPPAPQKDDLCFLQFTSGSTGDAKGVMITHDGLIHNVKLMRKRYKSTPNTVLVSWLPQYHDMGLIGGLFTAMVSGGTAILFSPMTFIKNPLLWLEIMSKYRATHSAGPNFAFELMVRRLETNISKARKYDLSSMAFLMIAAEPVRQKTLKKFIDLTSSFGLSEEVMAPGYGLAENCVFVSCAFGEGKSILIDWQGRVCCGYVGLKDDDVDIKIVDSENGEVAQDGKEGEIWISSPSAGIGYWGREELSERTFKNTITNFPHKIYTRTGDLGRIIEGNLFITGRIKDLIIVAGRNVYSADVEKTVETSSDLLRPGCCAVIGVTEEILSTKGISLPDFSDQVGLVVIAEVRDGKPVPKEVIQQIQTRIAEEHGVTVATVKLIKPRTISKTTSGKIRRFECLKQFTDGTLSLVPDPILSKRSLMRSFTTGTCKEGKTPRSQLGKSALSPLSRLSNKEIVEFLKKLVSDQTGISVEKISISENLVSYGIDSIGVVRAAQKLSDFLGVPIGAVDIFTATCIEELASFSEDQLRKSEPQSDAKTSSFNQEHETDDITGLITEVSPLRQMAISVLQILALLYVCAIIVIPTYISISGFVKLCSLSVSPWLKYLIPLLLAPLVWILAISLICVSISIFGTPFLRPNYALTPKISIWSIDFVRWWALYKASEVSSKFLAVHLRGTVFLKYWYQLLGAKIGSSVTIDTVDITDPSLVCIGDGVVIAEGALIQSHEVKNGVISFSPIRIGRNSSIGPYAVLEKGSILGENVDIPALQKTEGGKSVSRSTKRNPFQKQKGSRVSNNEAIHQFIGLYMIGFLSSLSSVILYFLYIFISQSHPSPEHFAFLSISGAFHWFPLVLITYATIFGTVSINPQTVAITIALSYFAHGVVLTFLTAITNHLLKTKIQSSKKTWLRHRLNIACHLRFTKLLSGTEAFCMYLRLLGAKIGKHCSIRAINPVLDPRLLSLGDGVHLGDFSKIVTGFYSCDGFKSGEIEVRENSVLGSQSLLLPGSVVQENVILGAVSVCPMNSVLQRGGVYIGSERPVMIKNTMHALDERIEEMDTKYKKIIGNLAANLAATTLKVNTRYFHRIGVGGKGFLKIYDKIKGFPNHKLFSPGKSYPVIVRHSNSLSADDDARIDARGAALRILSEKTDLTGGENPLLDLTLKTGKAFYARTVSDFATWLVCGLPAREEHVKRAPHIRDAVWTSLRNANSFTEMHYYSNICRLVRFEDGNEMYVKFKLRPADRNINENCGEVEPTGILPPETGAIPRAENDTRPKLFLAEDFHRRVSSPGGVHYVFQIQFQPVPHDEAAKDILLDCTRPWDEKEYPFIDVGEIVINENLTSKSSEELQFNPFLRSQEVDVIRATSASQSASIDHGRSLIYEICQHLRNGDPLPDAWRNFLVQSDVKVDLSGCPMASVILKKENKEVTLARTWYQALWAVLAQPVLQTILPYYFLGLIAFSTLQWVLYLNANLGFGYGVCAILPFFWVFSGISAGLACVLAKWILVGKRKEGENLQIWSKEAFLDTIWQAFRTVVGEYFMGMVGGSFLFIIWMNLLGSEVDSSAYVDSMEALLNPEMVEIESEGCVGREALLFGHIYEGEGGTVKFGKISIGEGGFVGSRAVVMPGVRVESGGRLSSLSLAMKEEIVKAK